jgi:hypothetical protein
LHELNELVFSSGLEMATSLTMDSNRPLKVRLPNLPSMALRREKAFSKLKAHLRKATKRSVDGHWTAIGRVINLFTPGEFRNYFKAAEYNST